MRKLKISLMLMIFIGLSFLGCHTYVFQPVKKQIVGTWIKSPQDSTLHQEWTFTDDGKLFIVDVQPGISARDTARDCDSLTFVSWQVENKITKHYLYTDTYDAFCSLETPPRWLVIKVNKKELYLSSEENKKIKGSWQYGFVKQ